MGKVKVIVTSVLIISFILFGAGFLYGRTFESVMMIPDSYLKDIPTLSFSDDFEQSSNVVMLTDFSGYYIESYKKDGFLNTCFITDVIYFNVGTVKKFSFLNRLEAGGSVIFNVTKSFSYVTYMAHDYWESRYKFFGRSYNEFLTNYHIDETDTFFTVYQSSLKHLALNNINIDITLSNLDDLNPGDVGYSLSDDSGYVFNAIYVHAVEQPENIENNIKGFEPINKVNYIHSSILGDPNYYINNQVDFPRTIEYNQNAPRPRLALENAFYIVEFVTVGFGDDGACLSRMVFDISFDAGYLKGNQFNKSLDYEFQIIIE